MPQAQITGSPVALTLGTSATPGAQAITVPADAEGVLVFSHHWNTQVASMSSNFSGSFTVVNNTAGGNNDACVAYARVTSTGSKTLTPTFVVALTEGPCFHVVFVKNIPKTGTWVREAKAESDDTHSNVAFSMSVSSKITDLVIAQDGDDSAAPANEAGWTSIATAVVNVSSMRLRTLDSVGASSSTMTTQGTTNFGHTAALVSVMSNLVRVGQQIESSGSSAATTLAVSLTTTEPDSSIHLPITCSTGFTVSSVVSSPTLTWTQRNAIDDGNQALCDWTADGAADATTYSTTITFSGSVSYRGTFAKEILATAGYDAAASAAHAAAINASPGTGADGISTGNTSALSAHPALISAAATPTSAPALAAAGTGFTLDGTVWPFSGDTGTSESKRVTSTAALAATFTAPINTAFLAVASVFLEDTGSVPTTVNPSKGALVLTGYVPTVTQASPPGPIFYGMLGHGAFSAGPVGYAQSGELITAGGAVTLNPAKGSLTLTGHAPTVVQPRTLSPAKGALTLTGYTPQVSQARVLTPTKGTLTLTGYAPQVSQARVLTPTKGALTLTGYTPVVVQPRTLSPAKGSLTLTGYAPQVSQARVLTPTKGSLTLTGYAPAVTQSAAVTLSPTKGTLTLTGYAPQVSQARVLTPTKGTLTLTGYAPVVVQPRTLSPAKGSLTLTGYAPTVTQPRTLTPLQGSLLLTGYAPAVTQARVLSPAKGALTLTGYAPLVSQGAAITLEPATGHLVLTGYSPLVGQALTLSPAKGALLLTGYAPSVTQTTPTPVTLSPEPGHLVLTGYAPTVTQVAPAGSGRSHTDLYVRQILVDYYTEAFKKREPEPVPTPVKKTIAQVLRLKPLPPKPPAAPTVPELVDLAEQALKEMPDEKISALIESALKFNSLVTDFSDFAAAQDALQKQRRAQEDEELILFSMVL